MPQAPIEQVDQPPGGFLGIGTDITRHTAPSGGQIFPPSGRYATNYDQLIGPHGRRSPSEIQSSLALPSSNQADGLFRLNFPPGLHHFQGPVGPQGPSYGSHPAFGQDYPGGGTQIVTDSHHSQVQPERIVTGGETTPTGGPLNVRAYPDVA